MDRFSKNIQMSIFMKIRPLGAELLHADREGRTDGRTDGDNVAIIRFSQFLGTRLKHKNTKHVTNL
jgi:hypothetical protein